jgi:hypothetical protein
MERIFAWRFALFSRCIVTFRNVTMGFWGVERRFADDADKEEGGEVVWRVRPGKPGVTEPRCGSMVAGAFPGVGACAPTPG